LKDQRRVRNRQYGDEHVLSRIFVDMTLSQAKKPLKVTNHACIRQVQLLVFFSQKYEYMHIFSRVTGESGSALKELTLA
jgi:hypothetical protein